MSTTAEDIRDYLVAQNVVASDSCFVGDLPPTPDTVVAVAMYGGAPPVRAMGDQNVKLRTQYVQVLVRSQSYATAADLMDDVLLALDGKLNVTANGHTYDQVVALGGVIPLIPDDSTRPVFSLNLETSLRP